MTKHNAENERVKRAYLHHLRAALGLSEDSIGVAASAIIATNSRRDLDLSRASI